jgi:ABC-type glycerol-3-phosphate transport system substrate-binding protein
MMRRFLPFGFLMLLLLAACASPSANQPATETKDSLDLTVFRAPT